jgi:putative oxidoreductase
MEQARPYVLGLFRIVIGFLFTCHGLSDLFGAFGGHKVPAGTWPGWYAGLIHLVCGILMLVGFGTRSAAFLSSGSMAYAYFTVHQQHALLPIQNGGEPAALFCWATLVLVVTGSGALGIDQLLAARSTTRPAAGASGTQGTGDTDAGDTDAAGAEAPGAAKESAEASSVSAS